jgi:hypothetical protein
VSLAGLRPRSDPQGRRSIQGLLLRQHGAADGHDQGDDAVDALGALVLGGLEVAGGVLGPRRRWLPSSGSPGCAVGELLRDGQPLQLARGRRYRAEALAELEQGGALVHGLTASRSCRGQPKEPARRRSSCLVPFERSARPWSSRKPPHARLSPQASAWAPSSGTASPFRRLLCAMRSARPAPRWVDEQASQVDPRNAGRSRRYSDRHPDSLRASGHDLDPRLGRACVLGAPEVDSSVRCEYTADQWPGASERRKLAISELRVRPLQGRISTQSGREGNAVRDRSI